MSTVQEIERAIETLPFAERLRLYKDMPELIGRHVEDLDWQRAALEHFFEDDSPDGKARGWGAYADLVGVTVTDKGTLLALRSLSQGT